MVLENPGAAEESPLSLRDIPLPTPGPGQIRVHVSCCGVCHTDLHIVEGDLPLHKKPVVPGHQVVGIVDALGPGASTFKEGERAGIIWLHSTDGTCSYCRSARENLCDNARFTGYDVDGGYAEAVLVPEAFAYKLPEGFADENAAPLLCAGAKPGCPGGSSPRSGRLMKSYGSQVTTGVTSKFSVGGGEGVFHSKPVAGHGLSPATLP